MCMYASGIKLLMAGSSPEIAEEFLCDDRKNKQQQQTTGKNPNNSKNKPTADLRCLEQRYEGLQSQTSSATLGMSFEIAFLPPKSGILLIQ